MVVLRAIGNFFVKIGRWIKETAWIQPLLIVGGIFAIIFSIPYISKWVSSWFDDSNAATAFYKDYKVSLDGAQNADKDSDANKLFTYMQERDPEGEKKWGKKFFIVFVQEDCAGCEEIYKGFDVLDDNWGKNEFVAKDGEDFKMYTIFIDSETTVNDETKNLFKDYFFDSVDYLFEEIIDTMQDSNYAKNVSNSSSYINELQTVGESDNFASPTVFLYDPEAKDNVTQLGVSEVLFTVPGKNNESGSFPIARTLYDCWYHQDLFSSNPNA